MGERREARRVDVDLPITLSVEGMAVRTRMINFSDDGALFRIDPADEETVSAEDLGKEGTFALKLKSGPIREYRGEVLRFYFKGRDRYLVLRFWEKYREIPAP